jgi:hypothetical protein
MVLGVVVKSESQRSCDQDADYRCGDAKFYFFTHLFLKL